MSRKTKNSLILSILILGIGVTALWFYLSYKPKVTTPIPNNADSIICIDLINARNEILKNYIAGEKLDASLLFDIRTIGLKIPNYLLGFTCKEIESNAIFTSFEIEDTTLFNAWVSQLINDKKVEPKTNQFSHFVDLKKRYIFSTNESKKRLVISFGDSLSENDITKVCLSLLEGKNTMDRENKRIIQIETNPNVGFIWIDNGGKFSSESVLNLTMENRNLFLDGNLFLEKEYQFPSEIIAENDTNSSSYLQLNFGDSKCVSDFISWINPNKFEKISGINLDSIQEYELQKITFSLFDPQLKQDTFITYEYDDNFNKIEKKEVGIDVSPIFNASFSFKNQGVYSYLTNNKNIQMVNDTSVFTAFPLATVYAQEQDKTLRLTTKNSDKKQIIENTTSYFLRANVVFKEIDSIYLNALPLNKKILKNKSITLEGIQKGDSTCLKGRIRF